MADDLRKTPGLSVQTIYEQHARFVWLSLQRLGVQQGDLEDVARDVFVVVHRRLDSFDGTSRMTSWLFGICMRIAANYRRRHRRVATEIPIREHSATQVTADEMLVHREESDVAERILAKLPVAQRAVFVMYEIEALSCSNIAEMLGVPVGTVYSRLHAARRQVERIIPEYAPDQRRSG